MDLLFEHMHQYINLLPAERELIASRLVVQKHKARTLLLQPGQTCRYSYFVTQGILRSFKIDADGSEQTLQFACRGWWMADMYSWITQKPAHLSIESLQDCELIVLSKNHQTQLFEQVPKLERYFRLLVEHSLVAHQERLLDNMSLTADERYQKFADKYPEIPHLVAQKHLASYLGVTPQFLSKLLSDRGQG